MIWRKVNLKLKGEIHQVRSYHTSKMNLVSFTINSNDFYHQFSKVSFFISTYTIYLFPHTKNHKQTYILYKRQKATLNNSKMTLYF